MRRRKLDSKRQCACSLLLARSVERSRATYIVNKRVGRRDLVLGEDTEQDLLFLGDGLGARLRKQEDRVARGQPVRSAPRDARVRAGARLGQPAARLRSAPGPAIRNLPLCAA